MRDKQAQKEYHKRYNEEHKVEIAANRHEYYIQHRAALAVTARAYQQEHKEELRKKNAARYLKDRERRQAKQRKYAAEHRAEIQAYRRANANLIAEKEKAYRGTHKIECAYSKLLYGARKGRHEVTLTPEEHRDLVQQPCFYCGAEPNPINGIDRVDNCMGYTPANSAACCTTCNFMKRAQGQAEFLEQVLKITKNLAIKEGLLEYKSDDNRAG